MPAFAFDAATFAFSAACLLGVPAIRVRSQEVRPSSLRGEIREGIQAVRASTWLWVSIVVFGLIGALDEGAWSVVLPKMVAEQYGGGVEGLGLIRSALAGGLVVGAVFMGQRPMPGMRGVWLYGRLPERGWLSLEWGWRITSTWRPSWLESLARSGPWCWQSGRRASRTWCPSTSEGGSAASTSGSYALLPVGTLASGIIADAAGPTVVFLVGGLGTIVLAGCPLLVGDVRTFGSDTGATRPDRPH